MSVASVAIARVVRSDSAVRLVRGHTAAPGVRLWGAHARPLFEAHRRIGPVRPGFRPWQVLGGPGSGKTALLVDLAAERIAEGVDPESLLVLTHSKQAAETVRDAITARLAGLDGAEGGVPGATREPLVRTVHSYAFSVLRRHALAHGNPPPRLLTGAEQDAVLREMLRGDLTDIAEGATGLWPPRLHPALGLAGFAEQLRDLMLRATERGLGPEDLMRLGRAHDKEEWVAAGGFAMRYEQSMLLRWSVGVEAPEATAPALDAAELVGAALDALAGDAELLAAERARIRYLLVDDAQHLDPQAALLVRVIGAAAHLAVVAGDPDQAVFTFRGADSGFLTDLDVPDGQCVVLAESHRASPPVRAAVARIAARLPGVPPHRFTVPARDAEPVDRGAAVRVRVLATPAKEAALIADHLRRAHLTAGVPWSRMAVIVRSVPLSLAPLRRALLAAGVPVQQPALDVPLARRRGAAWMLVALRALLAGERAANDELFSAEDALDLLGGPLGGADQITLRRLRRGIRRSVLELERARGWTGHDPDIDEWESGASVESPTDVCGANEAVLTHGAGVPDSGDDGHAADVSKGSTADAHPRTSGFAEDPPGGPDDHAPDIQAGRPESRGRKRSVDDAESNEGFAVDGESSGRSVRGVGARGRSSDGVEIYERSSDAAESYGRFSDTAGERGLVSDAAASRGRSSDAAESHQRSAHGESRGWAADDVDDSAFVDRGEIGESTPGDVEGAPSEEWVAYEPEESGWYDSDVDWGIEVDDSAESESVRQRGESARPAWLARLAQRERTEETNETGGEGISLSDRSSAELLRELIVGSGEQVLLEGLTEVESAPLRRVLTALERARKARRSGAGLEEVLWALWTASRLERRWVDRSERGGAVGMQADRDLDAAVALFDAAAAYVDRLPRASIEGFVEYLVQQEIPQDSRPLTAPGDAVALVSAHAAAGREWDVVAVAAVQEGIWPNPRQRGTLLHTEDLVDLTAGIEPLGEQVGRAAPILAEERRLLLVACSRARWSLLVTAVESVSGERDLVPSRFLAEMLGHDDDREPGALPVVDPGRALVMHALVAELRGVVCDSDADPARRERAAHQLARLAEAGVPGTHPEDWYGTGELSSPRPLWENDGNPVALSPSTVELLRTCPLRWALERNGGTDGDNPHAVKGNLVHTLVQALAGRVPESQVRAALERTWRGIDPGAGWYSRQELRRTETMLETFMAWVRNTRGELTQAGVEVAVDCELPGRTEDEPAVRIKGRIDRLERDEFGRFVIVDVKTGKTPVTKQAAADHAQLATYQVAAAYGALDDPESAVDPADPGEPGGARLVYVAKPSRDGATERTQNPLDPEALDTWRTTIHDAATATRGPSYLAMRNDGCRHCAVSGSCPVQDTGRQVTDE
ncbi:ATP-dependent DNA helicase [Nocardia bovistercoris]|uniref:ATP-dependent DNA helicase n=1 Tax=Nocardia bovistercoris TaxID=2785916 RepID=UPI001E2AA324|nr:ATP-dependent DNA helicase [Nocardia bovistercoris]